jgi:hypothetical protein
MTIVIGTCRACAGSGNEYVTQGGAFVPCKRCDGTGDELGVLLLRAYHVGRSEALQWLDYSAEMARQGASMTVAELREKIG